MDPSVRYEGEYELVTAATEEPSERRDLQKGVRHQAKKPHSTWNVSGIRPTVRIGRGVFRDRFVLDALIDLSGEQLAGGGAPKPKEALQERRCELAA